jgi:DNA polymerase III subunit beta
MKFTIAREPLLCALTAAAGAVSRRATLPVLSHVLAILCDGTLRLTGTDLEVEITSRVPVAAGTDGATTLPAKKLLDIVRALPDGAAMELQADGDHAVIRSGRSRFTLATLAPADFPLTGDLELSAAIEVSDGVLKTVLERTAFAMASADVRSVLNGMLLEMGDAGLSCVASDGHRLSIAAAAASAAPRTNVLMPRRAVTELIRMLDGSDRRLTVQVGPVHVRVMIDSTVFTSRLLSGAFPAYRAFVPSTFVQRADVDREELKQAIARMALVGDEHQAVELKAGGNQITLKACQGEGKDDATEEMPAATHGDPVSFAFKATYMIAALGALSSERVVLGIAGPSRAVLVTDAAGAAGGEHVVMPMRISSPA